MILDLFRQIVGNAEQFRTLVTIGVLAWIVWFVTVCYLLYALLTRRST